MDIVKIAPENLEVANAYLSTGDVLQAATALQITPDEIYHVLEKQEVKRYIDAVYLDQGYRNRFRLAEVLDRALEKKLEDAEETGIYTNKDLLDIVQLIHKISVDHSKTSEKPTVQNNTQINAYGDGQYGKLMEALLGDGD